MIYLRSAGVDYGVQQGINTLARGGFTCDVADISREALKCLANALLLNEDARQLFVDGGWAVPAVQCYEVCHIQEVMIDTILTTIVYPAER